MLKVFVTCTVACAAPCLCCYFMLSYGQHGGIGKPSAAARQGCSCVEFLVLLQSLFEVFCHKTSVVSARPLGQQGVGGALHNWHLQGALMLQSSRIDHAVMAMLVLLLVPLNVCRHTYAVCSAVAPAVPGME